MPKIRSSLARGGVAVLGAPALVVTSIAIVAIEWGAAVALGYPGPFSAFASALAIPPVGTGFDESIAVGVLGYKWALLGTLGFVVLRAVVMALLVAMIVEMLDADRIDPRGVPARSLRLLPTTLSVSIVGMGLLTLASLAGAFAPAFGIILQLGAPIAGVYLFAFAPVIAAAERRPMPESLARSIRAARIPGTGNLLFAAIYVGVNVLAGALLLLGGRSVGLLGVNPSAASWFAVLLVNLLQVALLATLAFRYLSIAEEVPDPPEPAQRGRGRR
jgi:hypothetical protein